MNEMQKKVLDFHKKLGFTINDKPTVLPRDVLEHRLDALLEEIDEYKKANKSQDMVKIADALGDSLYLLLGNCVAHGIDIKRVFDEIHRSNMTKEINPDLVDGKAIKGEDYSPPNLDFINAY